MEALRTLLSVPGNRQNMIEKARSLPVDVLVLDLEDSVPVAEKANARAIVRDSIATLAQSAQRVFVRVNSLASGLIQDDLEAVVTTGISGINLPKPGSAHDVNRVVSIIERLESERGIEAGHIKLTPWVETAKGVVNAFEIASATPRIIGIIFGAEDFTLDTGMQRTDEGEELLYPRVMVLVAAKAAGVAAIDTPYNNFRDEEGLVREANLARRLGYDGKYIIHPSQVEPMNRIFSPAPEEVEQARRVVETFEAAEAQGFASTSLDGKLIDIPIATRARNLLAVADSIARQEAKSPDA
ncbi:MAG: CoA ester lyase [Chloroflexota bacterium]|nr:CoA ester lyase [Chloroflexota bacterium]